MSDNQTANPNLSNESKAWLISTTQSGRFFCSPLSSADSEFIGGFAAVWLDTELDPEARVVSFDVVGVLSDAIQALIEVGLDDEPEYPLIFPTDGPAETFVVVAPPDCENSRMVRFLELLAAASKNGFMVTASKGNA